MDIAEEVYDTLIGERLGSDDEDLECILDAHTALQRYQCVEMFRQGAKFERKKNWDVL